MKRLLPIVILVIVIALAIGLFYQFSAPRLVSLEPLEGSQTVPIHTNLRLTFSRTMQPDSVISGLTISPPVEGQYSWEGQTLVFTPVDGWPGGVEIQVNLATGVRSAGVLSFGTRDGYQASFRTSRPRLVYLFPSGGLANLYTIQPETGEIQALTNIPSGVLDFDVSPRLNSVFYSVRNTQGGSDIYRLNLDTSQSPDGSLDESVADRVIGCSKSDCLAPQVSSKGDYLAYERTDPFIDGGLGYPQVWVAPLGKDGLLAGESSLLGDPAHQVIQPDWAQEAQPAQNDQQEQAEILLVYDDTLASYVVFRIGQGEAARFANDSGEAGSWAPGGSAYVAPQFFYLNGLLPDGSGEIGPVINSRLIRYSLNNAGEGTAEDLSQDEGVEDMLPAYSPDSTNLVFARRYLAITRWTPGRQIWLMPLTPGGATSQPYPLTDDPYYTHYDFSWSPDSSRLAYVRFNQTTLTESPEIWIIDPLTSQKEELVVGGYAPQWLP